MGFLKGHWQLILITAIIFALWRTPIAVPLKIFVVFLHELSHGLAAEATGGDIVEISISAQQGGHAVTRGGSRFLTLTAGYLGSLVLGILLLLAALRSKADRAVMAVAGATMLIVTALYIRDGFAVIFSFGTGVAMLAIAYFFRGEINDFVLRVLGLTSIIYVPYDIFSDTIARSALRSDARMLAEEFGGATMMWGGLWLILSAVVIFVCLRYGIGRNSNIDLTRQPVR